MPLMQRCALAFVPVTIVMFVGVLDELAVQSAAHAHPPPALHPWLHLRAGSPGVLRVSYIAAAGSALNGNL